MRRGDCTVFLGGAAILWSIALAVLLATMAVGCAPIRRDLPESPHLDGYQRELMACDAEAESSDDPSEAYDACLAIRGLGATITTNEGR